MQHGILLGVWNGTIEKQPHVNNNEMSTDYAYLNW